ncbi:MAG: SPASM domain-containing protein [Candidatus Competibacteraceae bacterium]
MLSCCHDFDSQNLMGDLTRQSVKEAWYGQQFAALRKRLNQGDRSVSELCNGCDHKPDLAYFQWNATLPKVKGKAVRLVCRTAPGGGAERGARHQN